MKVTSGKGHGAALDPTFFAFGINNVSRASTLFLCGPQYEGHLQQSLRRATADRGFHIPDEMNSEGIDLMHEQFDFYGKMCEADVPTEDARNILPLYTKTTILSFGGARELNHLHSMSKRPGVPSEVKDTMAKMYAEASKVAPKILADRGTNYETLSWMPSPQLFALKNKTIEDIIDGRIPLDAKSIMLDNSGPAMSSDAVKDAVMGRNESELANLKHYHFSFLAPMSLSSFHQATRQRTWDQSVQSIYSAVERREIVIPPSVEEKGFADKFHDLSQRSLDYVLNNGGPEDIGVVPHSLQVYDLIHVNGWNAVHSIGKRTCDKAQWEIRGIAKSMARSIRSVSPEIGQYAVPQGITYGGCPEAVSCGKCPEKKIIS